MRQLKASETGPHRNSDDFGRGSVTRSNSLRASSPSDGTSSSCCERRKMAQNCCCCCCSTLGPSNGENFYLYCRCCWLCGDLTKRLGSDYYYSLNCCC